MFCGNCGKQMPENAQFCENCGAAVLKQKQEKQTAIQKLLANKKLLLIMGSALVLLVIAIVLIVSQSGRCKTGGCREKAEYGDYCIDHVCLHGNCTNPHGYGSDYCYLHSDSGSSSSSSYSSVYTDLEFFDIDIEHNSSYTVATGRVRNNGSRTYKFVEIKGAFKDYSGNVQDTDWTYAVGSEGLAPGEATSFRLSCDKNYSISKCDISIIDYD